jgi:hypothetical protein
MKVPRPLDLRPILSIQAKRLSAMACRSNIDRRSRQRLPHRVVVVEDDLLGLLG